jgi:hypothetical protein
LSYHGVDIVVHVRSMKEDENGQKKSMADTQNRMSNSAFRTRNSRWPSRPLYSAQRALYQRLPDISEPNFYHPYKKGAARFAILKCDEPFELHIVTDQRLGFEFSRTNIETNMTFQTAHPELRDLCDGIDDAVLRSIRWPSLVGFLSGWLQMAETHQRSHTSMIYLIQAERLCDANDLD